MAADTVVNLSQAISSAAMLEVEDVCVPVKTVRRGELMWVPNPDGETYDLLQWYFRDYGGPTTVFIMDLATGEIKQDGIPLRRQIHICGRALSPVDGKLYIASPDWKAGMNIFVYDPATNELTDQGVRVPDLTGEKRDLTIGTDGSIYGTGSIVTEKKAGLYRLDPSTGDITVYGPVGPSHAPNGVWGYSIAADDRHVYVASGKIPWYLVAYDRQTGTDTVLLTTENVGGIVAVQQHRHGCSAVATRVLGTDGARREYWLYEGKAIEKTDGEKTPPWPVPSDSKPWVHMPRRPEVSLAHATPDASGSAGIWYRPVDAEPAEPRDPQATHSPEALGWRVFRLQVPVYPTGIHRLTELPDGRIFGTAGAYEGNFIYAPDTDRSTHMGKIPLSHYATAIHDGKVYMSGYPTSPLFVYDPAKPWTAGKGSVLGGTLKDTDEQSNPRLLVRLGDKTYAGTHKMYAAAVGADGVIYFGGRWYRDGSGGGLGWWNPQTQTPGGIWDVFSNYQIDYMTTAAAGQVIVISSRAVRDATLNKPTPEQGRLFVFDVNQRQIVRHIDPIPGVPGTGPVAGGSGKRVVGFTVAPDDEKQSVLYGVDVTTGDVTFRKRLPYPLGVRIGSNQKEAFDFRMGPDGWVWTFVGDALVRIRPDDGKITIVGRIKRCGRLAFTGTDLYLAGQEQLRRVPGILRRNQE